MYLHDNKRRICLAMVAIRNLNSIWNSEGIMIIPNLNCKEDLSHPLPSTDQRHRMQKLQIFEMSCLMGILGIALKDKLRQTNIFRNLLNYHKHARRQFNPKRYHISKMMNFSRSLKVLLEGLKVYVRAPY